MIDNPGRLAQAKTLPQDLPECPEPGQGFISPLGWSIKGRLLCVLGAIALLWLSVAWAMGWLK